MTRSIEFFAGLIGGAFAFIASLITIIFEFDTLSDVPPSIWLGLLFAIIAITGAFILRRNGVIAGVMLIVASVGVFFTITLFHLASALLILIAGLSGILKMNPDHES